MTGGKRILLITVVGLAVSIMVWLTLKQSPASSQSLFKLTILTTGEELGYIEPCGCAEDQNGGLSRRDSFIKSVRKESSHLLVAGNGDVIGKPGRQEEIKYEIAMTAMHEMGYDTLNVGEGELLLGIQQLQRFKKINRFSMVSANLLFEGRPLFERYVIKAYQLGKNEVKVAIIGIISKSFEGEAKVANSGFSILDPITALEALKEELTDEADVVILLAHTTLEESKKLAVAFPWIDVIAGQTCTQGQQGCLSLGNDCFDTWTLFARAVNVIRPCSPSDACQATANTEHSVTVHNTCPTAQSIYIRYTVTINRANTQQEQCNVGTPNSQFVDGTHSVPANGGTFTNSYSQSFTDTLTNCLNCEYRVTALTEAGSAGADRTDELTFFGDCRNRPGC